MTPKYFRVLPSLYIRCFLLTSYGIMGVGHWWFMWWFFYPKLQEAITKTSTETLIDKTFGNMSESNVYQNGTWKLCNHFSGPDDVIRYWIAFANLVVRNVLLPGSAIALREPLLPDHHWILCLSPEHNISRNTVIWMPLNTFDDKSTLVQLMAWCR